MLLIKVQDQSQQTVTYSVSPLPVPRSRWHCHRMPPPWQQTYLLQLLEPLLHSTDDLGENMMRDSERELRDYSSNRDSRRRGRRRGPTCCDRAAVGCHFIVRRWRMAFFALPFSAAAVVIRLVVWNWTSGPHFVLDTSTALLTVFAAVIVSAMLLYESAASFRIAGRVPCDVEVAFCNLMAAVRATDAARACFVLVFRCLESLADLLDGSESYSTVVLRVSEAEADMIRLTGDIPWAAAQIRQHATTLRTALARIEATSRHPPLPLASYALLDCAALYSVAVLVVFDCPSREAGFVAVGVITFLLSYIGLLVRALERPFDFPALFHYSCLEDRELPRINSCDVLEESARADFSAVFIDFAAMLRDAIAQCTVLPAQPPSAGGVPELAASDGLHTPSPRGRLVLVGSPRNQHSAPGFETVSLASVVPVGRA